MKKALITGVAGFVGSHLSEYLLSQKISVYGFFHPSHSIENILHLKDKINLVPCDILDKKNLQPQTSEINPDYVFHLAAFSSPADSFKNPKDTLTNNILGQLNLLEGLLRAKSKAQILIVGSGDEYGDIEKKYLPADEQTPLAPTSPYAVSKVAQDMLGLQFFLHSRLHIIRVRPFNHIGPRQSRAFVVPAFASQIAALEKEGHGTIKVGNLESWRDFTDVRDMVRAYLLALEKGVPGEVYNIGSGKPIKISDLLNKLISLSKAKIEVDQDKNLFRPVDIKKIYCNFSKFQSQTGWTPKIPLSKTLSDTIKYERDKLKSEVRNSKY
ncbi:hypothetical protein A2165_01745 [Candidatus Curtissbacteria bacterium RBG_13_40_7]|uniref:NAD(P)-binding domain-containing protein n=1 Tax=Candidatus Curtissbacteria bacterium RBG_13_40_7 TaxID=1797706 RepID=A0A1F5FV50_9BACT|nr:MAG: hypothetical protein A2165_01745 [Candidatus Curtissbacteria bacterium RBG_13_40_7]